MIAGTVHGVREREVSAVEARPAQYDDAGNFLRRAVDARDGYLTRDVTVLTEHGGFASVVLSDAAIEAAGGLIPSPGDAVAWPVRPFVTWVGNPGRKFARPGFSVAADIIAATAGGKRSSVRPVEAVNS